MATTVQVPDVCERDIDLLLLEEFVASLDFRSWFIESMFSLFPRSRKGTITS
jgi:hypothetical protein